VAVTFGWIARQMRGHARVVSRTLDVYQKRRDRDQTVETKGLRARGRPKNTAAPCMRQRQAPHCVSLASQCAPQYEHAAVTGEGAPGCLRERRQSSVSAAASHSAIDVRSGEKAVAEGGVFWLCTTSSGQGSGSARGSRWSAQNDTEAIAAQLKVAVLGLSKPRLRKIHS
jgi:hypothetical protein